MDEGDKAREEAYRILSANSPWIATFNKINDFFLMADFDGLRRAYLWSANNDRMNAEYGLMMAKVAGAFAIAQEEMIAYLAIINRRADDQVADELEAEKRSRKADSVPVFTPMLMKTDKKQ